MKEGLTIQERISIVREAERLIRQPLTFMQGAWKCPIFERPKTQEKKVITVNHPGDTPDPLLVQDLTPAKDEHGRPLYAYCVEGAINQAGLNLLGEDRAIQLGAAVRKISGIQIAESSDFAEFLSVNEVARVEFAELLANEYGEYWDEGEAGESPARFVNDLGGGAPSAKDRAHTRIMRILEKRIEQLRDKKLAGV